MKPDGKHPYLDWDRDTRALCQRLHSIILRRRSYRQAYDIMQTHLSFTNVDHSAHHNTRLLLQASLKVTRLELGGGDNEIQGKLQKERSLRNATVVLSIWTWANTWADTLREERSEFSRALHFILSASLLRHEN
jgi:hypothetical protein